MTNKEIITLQIGHYANHVGAHYWNAQEALFAYNDVDAKKVQLDHSTLFRTGLAREGQTTFTPRLVSIDLKGVEGSVSQQGGLYDAENLTQPAWHGSVATHRKDVPARNQFLADLQEQERAGLSDEQRRALRQRRYNLDGQVKTWTDYLRPHLHPRSRLTVTDFLHENEQQPFDAFCYGQAVSESNANLVDQWESAIHGFIEECDSAQGFQVLVDTDGGFGGLAASLLENIRDVYGNKPVLTFALGEAGSAPSTAAGEKSVLNNALCLERLYASSTAYIPLSLRRQWRYGSEVAVLNGVTYSAQLRYHTSAVLASVMDCITTPYRTARPDRRWLQEVCAVIGSGGSNMRLAGAACSWPFIGGLDDIEGFSSTALPNPLTPSFAACLPSPTVFGDVVCARGVAQASAPLDLAFYTQQRNNCLTYALDTGCPVSEPYPHIVTRQNQALSELILDGDSKETTACIAHVQSSTAVGASVQSLIGELQNINLRLHHQYELSGFGRDEWQETRESLLSLADSYLGDIASDDEAGHEDR